jgi:hypothetical protein
MKTAVDMPPQLRALLLELFGPAVDQVELVEYAWTSALLGWPLAVTSPRRVYLRYSAKEFFAYPELVVHEYFHVIRQWQTGRLTLTRYVWQSIRRGYWNNPFEIEAREFAALACRRKNPVATAINLVS